MRAACCLLSTALAAICLLGFLAGTVGGQTKSCTRNCLLAHANEPATVQRAVKPACHSACRGVRHDRKACLKTADTFWKDALKTCKRSIKGIKRGVAPLSISIEVGDHYDGGVTDMVHTYLYVEGCKQRTRSLWEHAKVSPCLFV